VAPRTQHEGTADAEHDDGDDGLVQPTHLPIAVQALEVVTVAIQDRRDAGERHAESRSEMEIGLAEQGMRVRPDTCAEAALRYVAVVAQHLCLLPRQRLVQFLEHGVGLADEPRHDLDPRVRR
jgi:hypothetical protein